MAHAGTELNCSGIISKLQRADMSGWGRWRQSSPQHRLWYQHPENPFWEWQASNAYSKNTNRNRRTFHLPTEHNSCFILLWCGFCSSPPTWNDSNHMLPLKLWALTILSCITDFKLHKVNINSSVSPYRNLFEILHSAGTISVHTEIWACLQPRQNISPRPSPFCTPLLLERATYVFLLTPNILWFYEWKKKQIISMMNPVLTTASSN